MALAIAGLLLVVGLPLQGAPAGHSPAPSPGSSAGLVLQLSPATSGSEQAMPHGPCCPNCPSGSAVHCFCAPGSGDSIVITGALPPAVPAAASLPLAAAAGTLPPDPGAAPSAPPPRC